MRMGQIGGDDEESIFTTPRGSSTSSTDVYTPPNTLLKIANNNMFHVSLNRYARIFASMALIFALSCFFVANILEHSLTQQQARPNKALTHAVGLSVAVAPPTRQRTEHHAQVADQQYAPPVAIAVVQRRRFNARQRQR